MSTNVAKWGPYFVIFSKFMGYPKWLVYNGKTIYKWMIWGMPSLHSKCPRLRLIYETTANSG
jgi:hypothetical protein